MTLMGAEALFYPTAIGSEPHDATLDTAAPWRRAMQGHAVSNVIPVVGANRTGFEPWPGYPGGGRGRNPTRRGGRRGNRDRPSR